MAGFAAASLALLMDPTVAVAVDLVGFSSPLLQREPWDTGWRSLEDHLVYAMVGDPCLLSLPGRPVARLEPGAWLLIPPRMRFRFRLAEPGGTALIERFRLRLRRGRAEIRLVDEAMVLGDAWHLAEHVAAVAQEGVQAAADTDLRRRARLILLFSEALRHAARRRRPGPVLSPGDVTRLRLFLHRRLPRCPGPADLAEELGLSPDYFARVFRRSLGRSPRAWLVDERIRSASARLLESDAPISAIAAAHGYAGLTLFGRQFRAVMGRSPRDWRLRHRTYDRRRVG